MRYTLKSILILLTFIAFFNMASTILIAAQSDDKETVYLLRSNSAMWLLASRIEDAGFFVERIGYSSLGKTSKEIVEDITSQINTSIINKHQTVHFVGHSLGGLLIRAYLDSNKVANLGRVVLIGTPNKGTPFVDKFHDTWWLKMLGSMTLDLGTDKDSFPNSLAEPYYPVGVIAGISDIIDNENIIPGLDDGVVPLESTKIEGMRDFVIIETGHSMMRYNEGVAKQTNNFLKTGKFSK
jgi:Palmitoyl protein thioesterase